MPFLLWVASIVIHTYTMMTILHATDIKTDIIARRFLFVFSGVFITLFFVLWDMFPGFIVPMNLKIAIVLIQGLMAWGALTNHVSFAWLDRHPKS